VYDFILNK